MRLEKVPLPEEKFRHSIRHGTYGISSNVALDGSPHGISVKRNLDVSRADMLYWRDGL